MTESINEDTQYEAVTSAEDILGGLIAWHRNSVMQANHLLNIPVDGSWQAEIDDYNIETTVVIDENNKDAFYAGVIAVLSVFDEFPLVYREPTDEEETNQES